MRRIITISILAIFAVTCPAKADETIRGAEFERLYALWSEGVDLDTLPFYLSEDSTPAQLEYVIQGYQNYKDSIRKYSTINLPGMPSATEIHVTREFLDSMAATLPREAYPNKERAALRRELKEFSERGGDLSVLVTLTKEVFDTLTPGEYFFAVGLNEQVRIGWETPREVIDSIVAATGSKPPRANHAFLFRGAPVLTAGALWVVMDGEKRHIERISANSGHYFYSNLHQEIAIDISQHSDRYFTSLAWFVRALGRLHIPCEQVTLSKM